MQKGFLRVVPAFSLGKSSFYLNDSTNFGLKIAQHTSDNILGQHIQLNLKKIKLLILKLLQTAVSPFTDSKELGRDLLRDTLTLRAPRNL